jgi:hypothetical protein
MERLRVANKKNKGHLNVVSSYNSLDGFLENLWTMDL